MTPTCTTSTGSRFATAEMRFHGGQRCASARGSSLTAGTYGIHRACSQEMGPSGRVNAPDGGWPPLAYEDWRETKDTLHMYTQVLGKLRLALSPPEPQWGHVPLYVTARGLTTSPIPVGLRTIDAELDLLAHELVIRSSDGRVERRALGADRESVYGGG